MFLSRQVESIAAISYQFYCEVPGVRPTFNATTASRQCDNISLYKLIVARDFMKRRADVFQYFFLSLID